MFSLFVLLMGLGFVGLFVLVYLVICVGYECLFWVYLRGGCSLLILVMFWFYLDDCLLLCFEFCFMLLLWFDCVDCGIFHASYLIVVHPDHYCLVCTISYDWFNYLIVVN